MNSEGPSKESSKPDYASPQELEELVENREWYASKKFLKAVSSVKSDNPEELTDICGFALERGLRNIFGNEPQALMHAHTANLALDKLYALAKSQGPEAVDAMQKRLTGLVSSISQRHPGIYDGKANPLAQQLVEKINRQGAMPKIADGDYLEPMTQLRRSEVVPVSWRESYKIQRRARQRVRAGRPEHEFKEFAGALLSRVVNFYLSHMEKWKTPRIHSKHGIIKSNQIPHSPKSSLHPEQPVKRMAVRAAHFVANGVIRNLNYAKRESMKIFFNLLDIGQRKHDDGPVIKDKKSIPPSPRYRRNLKPMRPQSRIKKLWKNLKK